MSGLKNETAVPQLKQRLHSLDALRGFDMFLLMFVGPFILAIGNGPLKEDFHSNKFLFTLLDQVTHRSWIGYTLWDQIMPLFMFMAGVAIPYALSRYKKGEGGHVTWKLWVRLARRFCLLWLIGMVMQGRLLSLKWDSLYLFSNTLQAIAVGYLFSSIFFLFLNVRGQIAVTAALLLGYWLLERFIHFDDIGGGTYERGKTLAEWVDKAIMVGHWHPGGIHTWFLSSMNFTVTVMTGVFAGELTRSHISFKEIKQRKQKKGNAPSAAPAESALQTSAGSFDIFVLLLAAGIVLAVLGFGWSRIPETWFGYCPLIKNMWTSSMTLLSSGYSFILLSVFYLVIDVLNFRKGLLFLTVIGTNSLVAYFLAEFCDGFFVNDINRFLFGTEQYIGEWYPVLLVVANFLVCYWILRMLYKSKRFVRV